MPSPRLEGAVEVGDEVLLGEVEFDVAKDVREQECPQLLRGQ